MQILFLSTWFPYPLSQGSKIRAYHLLRSLALRHEVQLISFADAQFDPAWIEHVADFCADVEIVDRNPFTAPSRKRLQGWISRRPSAATALYSSEMAAAVDRAIARQRPDALVALTFVTAPYCLPHRDIPAIVDVDNVLTTMLGEGYRGATTITSKTRRWLAWRKFRAYERALFGQFDAALAVSPDDQTFLTELLDAPATKIPVIPNGVDLAHNHPGLAEAQPNELIFNGALTYGPNLDAMDYFLGEILPAVQAAVPEAALTITGSTAGVDLKELPARQGVRFSGFVDDIRPLVAEAWACVVPLRQGAGTRLKILEAMALGTPVVTTTKGAEGLGLHHGQEALIADTPTDFGAEVVRLLQDPALRARLSEAGRRYVEAHFDWQRIGADFCAVVEGLWRRGSVSTSPARPGRVG